MSEHHHCQVLHSPEDLAVDSNELIHALRLQGANLFDPVGFQHLVLLAGRSSLHRGRIRDILDRRLAEAIAAFRTKFEEARDGAKDALALLAPACPNLKSELENLLAAGDFVTMTRRIATLAPVAHKDSLGDLVRMAQQNPFETGNRLTRHAESQPELKSVRHFRDTWSKLSADKHVSQALKQGPKNAGPINSHMVILRSLAIMRDISPDYLNHFMAHVDTLLCLDREAKVVQPAATMASDNGAGKKSKTIRSRSKKETPAKKLGP